MEKVIKVLSEIEDKAGKILDRTKEQKQLLYDQLNKDLAKLDSDIKADMNKKIDSMQKEMEVEITKERQTLLNDCEKDITALQANFDANHDALVTEIFTKIINS